MNYSRNFGTAVVIGVLANCAIGVTGVFAPDLLLSTVGVGPAYPDLWARFASLLLILLSAFYVPGAIDPGRYRANAWLSVASRVAGVVFFSACVALLGLSHRFLLFAGYDLFFALITAPLLILAVRRGAQGAR